MSEEIDNRVLGDPGTSAFQVRKYPFFQLNRLVSRYNAIIEARLRPIGLDIPYWRVLMVLGERSPLGVRAIADASVIPLSTMTRIVQRMASSELVRLFPSETDARVTEVELDEKGLAKLAEARKVTAPVYSRIIRGFRERDFDALLLLLDRMYQNIEQDCDPQEIILGTK